MSFKGGPGGDIGDIEIKTTNTGSLAQLAIAETVSPPAPADGAGGILYTKADGKPYWISNEVSETDLSAAGGGGGISHDGSTANGILTYKDADEATVESKALVDGAKITIGNGTAEDTLLVFDGNAADFRMGIDDDSDTLEIGAGAAHDTTAAVIIDGSGHVTKIGQDSPSSGEFLKWDGSKAVWDAPSATVQHAFTIDGFAKIANSSNYYGHNWAGSNQERYFNTSVGTSIASPATGDTLSVTVANSGAYFQLFTIPAGMQIQSVRVNFYQAGYTARWRVRVWKSTPSDNSNANMTWTAIGEGATNATAVNAKWANAFEDLSSDGNRTVAAGDVLGITWDGKNIGSTDYASSNGASFTVTILANYT